MRFAVTEAEAIAHEEELKDILREEAHYDAMKMREQEEIDDIQRHEREQDERDYQNYLEEMRQEQQD